MYRVFYFNFSTYDHREFADLSEAIAHGRSQCFEFSVYDRTDGVTRAIWSPIGGLSHYEPR